MHKINKGKEKNVTESDGSRNENGNTQETCTWINEKEKEDLEDLATGEIPDGEDDCDIIEVCEKRSKEFMMSSGNHIPTAGNSADFIKDIFDESVPYNVFWSSILLALENCRDDQQLINVCNDIKERLPEMKPREHAEFSRIGDIIDRVAQAEIPLDGPQILIAIQTVGDGNCLCRALSRAYYNDDQYHLEIRARMVIEGTLNKEHYISDDCLERGATCIHNNANLPTVFATFSEYYTPGQKLNEEMIRNIYSLELHGCARVGSYMGLWQLSQASSVFGVPIHTIYPNRAGTIRNDFHRMFFPVDYPVTTCENENPIVIMWTGMKHGSVPVHFVPLLKNPQ